VPHPANDPRRIGVFPDLFAEPLTRTLRSTARFSLNADAPLRIAIRLREQTLHAGLISPIEYARQASLYRIVPGIAVSSQNASQAVTLHFHEGKRSIRTLAVDPGWSSEIILAKIILAEEFDVQPQIVPAAGGISEMLAQADAALVIGDKALRETPAHGTVLDVVEAWQELTGLPFVHAIWCGREQTLRAADLGALGEAHARGKEILDAIADEAPASHDLPRRSAEDLRAYLDAFSYDLTSNAQEGLQEFLCYGYYHGITADVPDLNFYPLPGDPSWEEEEPPLN
jgi:chorismate dehydratase